MQSAFFAGAARSQLAEGVSQSVDLKKIEPAVVDDLLRFVYGPDTLTYESILAHFLPAPRLDHETTHIGPQIAKRAKRKREQTVAAEDDVAQVVQGEVVKPKSYADPAYEALKRLHELHCEANFYLVAGLEEASLREFEKGAKEAVNELLKSKDPAAQRGAFLSILEMLAGSDEDCEKALINIATKHYKELLTLTAFQALLPQCGELASSLLLAQTFGGQSHIGDKKILGHHAITTVNCSNLKCQTYKRSGQCPLPDWAFRAGSNQVIDKYCMFCGESGLRIVSVESKRALNSENDAGLLHCGSSACGVKIQVFRMGDHIGYGSDQARSSKSTLHRIACSATASYKDKMFDNNNRMTVPKKERQSTRRNAQDFYNI